MYFLDDILSIVVPQATAQLLIVHGGLILFLSPHLCDCGGLEDLELIVLILGPLDQISTVWIN